MPRDGRERDPEPDALRPSEHPLARLERELRAPPRRRLELLEEVEADAEALERELVRRGRSPLQARDAALRRLIPDGETLRALEAQHAPRLGRWVRGAGRAQPVERLGIAMAAFLAGAAATSVIRAPGAVEVTSPLTWAQVVVFALLAANWAQAAFVLWVDGDLRPHRRRALWRRQVGLMVSAVAIGAFGTAWEAYLALGALETDGSSALAAWGTVRRAVSFAALGIAAATFGLFGWLSLLPRMITDEGIERRIARFFRPTRPRMRVHPSTPQRRE